MTSLKASKPIVAKYDWGGLSNIIDLRYDCS